MIKHSRFVPGFTLVEIIAVLILLGILGAVAVPKYIALQNEAATTAAQGGISAAMSALSMGYAANTLNGSGGTPNDACSNVRAEQLSITCSGTDWNHSVDINVTHEHGETANGTWTPPSSS